MKIQKVECQATFTRPNDTTAYAAKDAVTAVVAAVITFLNAGAAIQRNGFLRGAKLMVDGPVITNGSFRLHLFSVAPTAVADNAALSLLFTDAPNYLGFVDFALKVEGAGAGAMAYDAVSGLSLPIVAQSDDLFGVLEATAAYVPTANENFRLSILLES